MSKESAVAFISKASSDPGLQQRIASLGQSDVDGLVSVAASAGFTVTPEDFRSAFSDVQELGDGELDQVSGGLNPQPLPPRWNQFLKINPGLLNGIIIVGGSQLRR